MCERLQSLQVQDLCAKAMNLMKIIWCQDASRSHMTSSLTARNREAQASR